MSVNDKWHYCHNCEVLVGSRAMRDRHLRLMGYIILQVSHSLPAHLGHVSALFSVPSCFYCLQESVLLIKYRNSPQFD